MGDNDYALMEQAGNSAGSLWDYYESNAKEGEDGFFGALLDDFSGDTKSTKAAIQAMGGLMGKGVTYIDSQDNEQTVPLSLTVAKTALKSIHNDANWFNFNTDSDVRSIGEYLTKHPEIAEPMMQQHTAHQENKAARSKLSIARMREGLSPVSRVNADLGRVASKSKQNLVDMLDAESAKYTEQAGASKKAQSKKMREYLTKVSKERRDGRRGGIYE
jgi:hypothetical protein